MARDPKAIQASGRWRKLLLWVVTVAITIAILIPCLLMTVPRYLPAYVECLPDGTATVITKRDGVLSQGFPALFEHRVPAYTRLESGELLNRYRLHTPAGADQIHGAVLPTGVRQTWWLGYRVTFSDVDFSHPSAVDPAIGFFDQKRDMAIRYWW